MHSGNRNVFGIVGIVKDLVIISFEWGNGDSEWRNGGVVT